MTEEIIEEDLDEEFDDESSSKGKKEKTPPIFIIDTYYMSIQPRSFDVYNSKDGKTFVNGWHYTDLVSAFKSIHRELLRKALHNRAVEQRADSLNGLIHMLNSFNMKLLNEVTAVFDTEEFKSAIITCNIERHKAEIARLEEIQTRKEKQKPKVKAPKEEIIEKPDTRFDDMENPNDLVDADDVVDME